MSRVNRGPERSRTLQFALIGATVIALLLAVSLGVLIISQGRTGGGITPGSSSLSLDTVADHIQPVSYAVTLDTSENPGAVVKQTRVEFNEAGTVSALPFATLAGMRFTGWYTEPATAANAVRIDNNSLDKLAPNTNQTLYARFEPRPTSVDYENDGLPILMYHYFYDPDAGEEGLDANWMDVRLFRSHLEYLQANHYYYPTWEEVVAYIRGEILLPERSIVLSSDDGHLSFYNMAAPLALQYGAKMTVFEILIDFERSRLELYDPERIFIESHSYDMHRGGTDGDARILTASYDEIVEDAHKGQEILGEERVYCLPFGKTNENGRRALADAGVGIALAIINDRAYPLCDPMEVPRLRMSDGASADYLASVAY